MPTPPLPDGDTAIDTAIEYLASPHSAAGIYDVVVVGAGPVGLATALGLRQRGIQNILVIDQTHAFRPVGQVVEILPNGLKALKSIDTQAYEEVKKTGFKFLERRFNNDKTLSNPSPQWVHKNLKGQFIDSASLKYEDWLQKYGEGRVPIAWHELQATLRNLLPQDTVKANLRCINAVNEPELQCVRVDCLSDLGVEANPYAYWADEKKPEEKPPLTSENIPRQLGRKSIRAKLVVAADGINSMLRRVLYENSPYRAFARPEYSGFCAVGCSQVSHVSSELLAELKEKFFQKVSIVTISPDENTINSAGMTSPKMTLFNRLGAIGYFINLALPLSSVQENYSHLKSLVLQALEQVDYPESLKQLVRLSSEENIYQRPYYIHRADLSDFIKFPSTAVLNTLDSHIAEMQPAWSIGRVVLAGDAAHGMPPFKAQGANQGLEDAMAIAAIIADIRDKNNWDDAQALCKAFEKYERLRRPFVARLQKATIEQVNLSEEEQQKYGEEVYQRDFDKMLEALL